MKDWIKSIRPKHWVKNGFCLAALIFSGQAGDLASWWQLIPLLAGFCLLSSGGYLINDAVNVEEDACHPRKRLRPLAAGRLNKKSVIAVGVLLAVVGFSIMLWKYNGQPGLVGWSPTVGLGYFILTVSYSLFLRELPLLDVLILGLGFIFRVVAGAFALDLVPTFWLLSCTYAVVLLIGFGKRQGEWRVIEHSHQQLGNTRKALTGYTPMVMNVMSIFCGLVAGGLYLAYCISRPDGIPFILTGIPVLTGLMSYLRLVWRSEQVDAPEDLLFKSPLLLGSVIVWVIMIILLPMLSYD